jgi:uncharacterized membrane protein
MDWAHIHLLLNHFPIILVVVGAAATVLGILWPRRSTWMYAATSLTLAGIMVVPTYFTGEPAERALNRPWYVERGAIHGHESSALISALIVGGVALIALFAWRRMVRYPREIALPRSLRGALLIGSLLASAHIFYTSLLGGRIVHDSPILHGPRPAGLDSVAARVAPTAQRSAPESTSSAAAAIPPASPR